MLWSYDKPTKAGVYNANMGDVVTAQSCREIRLTGSRNDEGDFILIDENDCPVGSYHSSWKFRMVDYDYLNTIGNKE